VIDHFNDLGQDLVTSFINFVEDLLLKIVLTKSNLDMDLGLSSFTLRVVKLRNERRLVPSLPTCFVPLTADTFSLGRRAADTFSPPFIAPAPVQSP
jgi:hypothetical protein